MNNDKRPRVAIGIQARSTSTRFPNKINEMIGDKTVLERCVEACESAKRYVESRTRYAPEVSVYLLAPKGDTGVPALGPMIYGDEFDCLGRYVELAKFTEADYIVRITSDCPMIPDFVISKAIFIATKNQYDFVSNAYIDMRTSIDGHDVEVMSRNCLHWLDENAVDQKDREHVTMLVKTHLPKWFNMGIMVGTTDLSHMKLSVDTKDDLAFIRKNLQQIMLKQKKAEHFFGSRNVHKY